MTRAHNPADGRSVLVGLTAKGRGRARRLSDARRQLFARLIADMDVDDRATVIDGLTRLQEAADVRA